MDANEILAKLRKSRFSWAVYIPLAVLLNVASILSGSCLAAVMVGLATFGVPFLLGVKGLGTLLKMGTLILVISGLVFGAVYTHYLYEQVYVFEERQLEDTYLEDGIVKPYRGDENTVYNFSVTYTGTGDLGNITVYVNITELGSEEETSFVLNNSGNLFYYETLLTRNVHNYQFALHSNATGGWNTTDIGIGPVAAPYENMLMLLMFQGIIIVFIPGGLFFYMIVLLYNSRKRAQEEQLKLAEEEKDVTSREGEKKEAAVVKGGFECTECGADVPEDASFCPRCGEYFEEEEKEEPEKKEEESDEFECTECGADVPGDATVCPSCGESFDEEESEKPAEKFMCTQCGADIPGEVTKCPHCGESFDGEDEKEE